MLYVIGQLFAISAAIAVCLLPTFLLCILERRMVWPYQSTVEPAEIGDIYTVSNDNPYASPMAIVKIPHLNSYNKKAVEVAFEMAEANGFVLKEGFCDARGGLYHVRYNFFLSSERDILALVGYGKIAGIPLRGMHLMTFLTDNSCLSTIDNTVSSFWDFTGSINEFCLFNYDFQRLLSSHRKRLVASRISAIQFSEDNPLSELKLFRRQWFDLLERKGCIRYLEPQRNLLRFTVKGALILSVRGTFRQLRRLVWGDSLRLPRLSQ
jgi:hypothetical protein